MSKICHIGPGQRAHHMRIFHRFCWSQVQSGHRVDLIAHNDGEPHQCGVHIHDLGGLNASTSGWHPWSRVIRNFNAYFLAIRTQADLYFFYSPEFIPFALFLKWTTGKPVVFDCMEDFIGYAMQHPGIPNLLRNIVVFAIRFILGFAARHLDFITVADFGTEQQFRKNTSKIVTIHNFPRLDLFPPLPSVREENCEFDLVYHGTNHRCYLEVILAIDEQLRNRGKDVKWYLFGTFDDFEWFQSELKRLKAENRFLLHGVIPHEQVFSEVRRAKIGIIPLPALPKYLNNIPQKLFEYMALGLPTILSDLPPSRPFVEKDTGIMVDPNDPVAYAKAIAKLLDDPNLRRRIGRRSRIPIEQKYNWEIESKKLMLLTEKLTKANPNGVLVSQSTLPD